MAPFRRLGGVEMGREMHIGEATLATGLKDKSRAVTFSEFIYFCKLGIYRKAKHLINEQA